MIQPDSPRCIRGLHGAASKVRERVGQPRNGLCRLICSVVFASTACSQGPAEHIEIHQEARDIESKPVNEPVGNEKGWWFIQIRLLGNARYVSEICADGRAQATEYVREHASKRISGSGWGSVAVTGVIEDAGCKDGTIAMEAW